MQLCSRLERQEHLERITAENAETRSGPYQRVDFPPGSAVGPESDENPRSKPVVNEEVRNLLFSAWVRRQSGIGLTRDMRQACRAHRFDPSVRRFVGMVHATPDYRRMQNEFRNRNQARLGGIELRDLTTGASRPGRWSRRGL